MGTPVSELPPQRSITTRRCRFRFAQIPTISEEDLLPVSNRTVQDVLHLGRFGIPVYLPQGISCIRVLRVSVTELGELHDLVADETRALDRIAPYDRPFVPCLFFRTL